MKIKFLLGALICALSISPLLSMEKPENSADKRVAKPRNQRWSVNDYINFKSFFLDLASIISDESIDKKKFARLLKYIKVENLHELFSINQATAARYFDAENLKRFIELMSESGYLASELKATTLKSCYNVAAWQELLGCQDLEAVLGGIIDLYFFTGTRENKIEKLKALKIAIARCIEPVNGKKNLITQYFDVPEILAIIDDLVAGKEIADERVIKTILCDASFKYAGCHEEIEHFTLINKLLSIVVTTLKAGTAPSFKALLGCLKWENILGTLPLEGFFVMPKLKELIKGLQNGILTNKSDVIDCIDPEVFQYIVELGPIKSFVAMRAIELLIDFDAITSFLNSLALDSSEGQGEILHAIKFDEIEKHLGIDVPNAFDSTIPEPVQTSKIMEIIERASSISDMRLLYSLPVIGYPIPLVLFWKALHSQAGLARYGLFSCAAFSAGTFLAVGWKVYARQTNSESYFMNAAVSSMICTGLRMASYLRGVATGADIVKQALRGYENHPCLPEFTQFVELLSEEALSCLTNRYTVCQLLENPFEFIDNNERFIAVCAKNKTNGAQLMRSLAALLHKTLPQEKLKMQGSYRNFIQALTGNDLDALPTVELLPIAQYRPAVLLKHIRFIASIQDRKTVDGKFRLLYMLRVMIEATQNPDDIMRNEDAL